MKLITASLAALFAATALGIEVYIAKPADSKPADLSEWKSVFLIHRFVARLWDGCHVGSVHFDVLATTGGTLNFTCVAYDNEIKNETMNFESGRKYSCDQSTFFEFTYDLQTKELYLQHNVSPSVIQTGKTIADPSANCGPGHSSATDMVCTAPDFLITVDNIPQPTSAVDNTPQPTNAAGIAAPTGTAESMSQYAK